MLGGPVLRSNLALLKIISTIFRLDVHILQILKYAYIPGMSPNSTMPFHTPHDWSIVFLSINKIGFRVVNLSISATLLKVRPLHFLKGARSLPENIVFSMYSLLTIKYHADFVSFKIVYQCKNLKL